MSGSNFKEVDLRLAKIGGQLTVMGSTFDDTLNMNGIGVGMDLSMGEKAIFKIVDLGSAKIGGFIDLSGSRFEGTLSMDRIKVGQSLSMKEKANFMEVGLSGAKIGGHVNLSGSRFEGTLNMNGIKVGQSLSMEEKANFMEVDLSGAKIGQNLSMSGSNFKEVVLRGAKIGDQFTMNGSRLDGELSMDGIEVSQNLYMKEKANFKEVSLRGAKIGGQLIMSGSTFDGGLNMNGIDVVGSLFMGENANFKEVDLMLAKIGGQLTMIGSNFDSRLNMEGIEVGQSLLARSTMLPKDQEVILHFANVGQNLDLSGATIGAIDLTATTITNTLYLGSKKGHEPTNWEGASRMVLRNTTVDEIQDTDIETDSWPQNLELEGFAYRRLGSFGTKGPADIIKPNTTWLKQWLYRDKTFSPQPYEQLANLLHESGYPSEANKIRYVARERSRSIAFEQCKNKLHKCSRWIGLTLLKYTIGYGLGTKYFRVLWCFIAFAFIGFLVLLISIEKSNWDLFKMAWASFDQVLPIVNLDQGHEAWIKLNCSNWAISYFYIQKIVGYVLGGFLGAGLAGLTQKS